MAFFKRRDEPFVQSASGWRPLQIVINEGWHSLAGFAWEQYQKHGRGAVAADFASAQLHYAIADAMRGDPELRELQTQCQRYNPKHEVVLFTTVTRGRGRNIHLSDLVTVLGTPRGGMSPPEAAAFIERAEESHRLWMAVSEQAFGDMPEELEKLRRKVDGRG